MSKQRNLKRKRVNEFNKKLEMNGLQPVTIQEFDNMEKFKKAYEMEQVRVNQNRNMRMLVLLIAGIAMLACYAFGGFEWVYQVFKSMVK